MICFTLSELQLVGFLGIGTFHLSCQTSVNGDLYSFPIIPFEVILPKLESFQSLFFQILFSPTLFPSGTLLTWKLGLLLKSQRSWSSVHFLLLYYLCCSRWVIFIVLYSSSLSRTLPFGSILLWAHLVSFFILVIIFFSSRISAWFFKSFFARLYFFSYLKYAWLLIEAFLWWLV